MTPEPATLEPTMTDTPGLPSTEITDDLIRELDSMDDDGRAPSDPIAAEIADDPATPVAAEPVSPVSPPAAPADSTTPVDPFAGLTKDAKPFTYKVDGTERTFEGIVITQNGAGYIAPEQVERIRNTFGLAEKSIADNKGLYERTQAYERLGGTQQLAALQEQVAQLDAAGSKLLALIEDPTQLLMLDGEGNVVKNQRAIDMLTRELMLTSKEAAQSARSKFQQTTTQHQQTAQQGEQQTRALDAVIDQFMAQHPDLTPQDRQAAKAHFSQFQGALFRPATPEDAQRYGYRIGELLIDTPKMSPWIEDRAALRASAAAQDKARRSAEDENKTRNPPKANVPRGTSVPNRQTGVQPRKPDGTYAEKQMDRDAQRTAMRRAHQRGEFYVQPGTEGDV